jgi:hypothetical protein
MWRLKTRIIATTTTTTVAIVWAGIPKKAPDLVKALATGTGTFRVKETDLVKGTVYTSRVL